MIQSRRATVALAVLAGLVSGYASSVLGANALIANAHAALPSSVSILAWFILPILILIAPVVLLSSKGHRLVAAGVGFCATLVAYGVLFGSLELTKAIFMQQVEYVNQTGRNLVVYTARDGERLSMELRMSPGQVFRSRPGVTRQGPWLRVVALLDENAMETQDHERRPPFELSPTQEQVFAKDKVYDQVFPWGSLRDSDGRVVLTQDSEPARR